MLKILVIGATSMLAHETCKHFASDGAHFLLVGRNQEKLDTIKDDLIVRGAQSVGTTLLDMNDIEAHPNLLENAIQTLDGIDILFVAHGTLPDQEQTQHNVDATLEELSTNFLSVVSILTLTANYMEERQRGLIAVISSVAGDRGRASNYIYGAAMAGKTAFLSGLRSRLASAGVHVLTIKPGQVATPMTTHLPRTPLFANAEDVGRDIYRAMKKGKDVIYTPFWWRYIMFVIRSIPEFIFKRLSL